MNTLTLGRSVNQQPRPRLGQSPGHQTLKDKAMIIEQLQLTLDLMSLKNRVKKLEQIQANYLKALTEYCSTLVISQETPGKEKSDG